MWSGWWRRTSKVTLGFQPSFWYALELSPCRKSWEKGRIVVREEEKGRETEWGWGVGARKTNNVSCLIWWFGASRKKPATMKKTFWIQLQIINWAKMLEGSNLFCYLFMSSFYIHTHINTGTQYLLSWGGKAGHRVLLVINPPPRLPTSDLSRRPSLVPRHDELWDSGGVTPSLGPPTHPLLKPLTHFPPCCVLLWVQHPVRPSFRPPKIQKRSRKRREKKKFSYTLMLKVSIFADFLLKFCITGDVFTSIIPQSFMCQKHWWLKVAWQERGSLFYT